MNILTKTKNWFDTGEPWVWLNASAVSLSLLMVFGLLALIAYNGLGHFWPADLMEAELVDGNRRIVLIGEIRDTETVLAQQVRDAGIDLPEAVQVVKRLLIKQGNRDFYGLDFRWVLARDIQNKHYPKDLLSIERREWGQLYGRLVNVKTKGQVVKSDDPYHTLQARLAQVLVLHDLAEDISRDEIGSINYSLEQLRLSEKKLHLKYKTDNNLSLQKKLLNIEQQRQSLQKKFAQLQNTLRQYHEKMAEDVMLVQLASGEIVEVALEKVIQVIRPNAMGNGEKIAYYFHQIGAFISDDPREANTEGGIFPAIFGTVLMVIIMSIMVTPLGVIAAIYLREYASQGMMVRIIRIAVNNLAGVPSIVYGIFGLGFFVYFIGGSIDDLFYPEASPAPVYGTPGLLWASITLALLTLPVVIVTTEEGLSRIPSSVREASLALGATKFETLWYIVLPMVSPAMITGLILAVARAAGEVAPLMLVGVVKLAPTLALDANYPFLHLDRKFMHLGFHIYDVGFQSPNVEAARPLVYATALLLVVVIILLNLTAITVRNRLREKYKGLEHES
ncbi:phosphate ABC transporter permease PstA [sulfur-oxidizing endosymbiont of Gigantopelta aegis]|uniref:phosphate ABC transporter permease PstA n=1 Tax=sulfur-oxidizing endosymbiont of Gigantopelta aegis TaxID=2794934 RepID=UPI0018DC1663|nr:phosphate ABC transporter permease PstA [sulfur-oxidizing endosymbiont of Gigantopelta aegis]